MPFLANPAFWKGVAAALKWLATSKSWWAIGARLVLTVAASYGIGRMMQRKLGGLTNGNPLDVTRDPLTPRRVIWGHCRTGGAMRLHHVRDVPGDPPNEYLYLILVWCAHRARAIDYLMFNDEIVRFDAAGDALGTYAGFARVTHHLGEWNQEADANFLAEIPGIWTSTDRLRGCTYSAIRLKADQSKWPTGLPLITAVGRWRIPYDPRDEAQDPDDDSTWEYTDNAAVCWHDFNRGVPVRDHTGSLVRLYGLNAQDDEIVTAAAITAANTSDELVGLAAPLTRTLDYTGGQAWIGTWEEELDGLVAGMVVSGPDIPPSAVIASISRVVPFGFTLDLAPTGTHAGATVSFADAEARRYTVAGAYDLDAQCSTVVDSFISATAGKMYDVAGDVVIRVGAWEEPDVELDMSALRGAVSVSTPLSWREKLNHVRGVYTNPDAAYNRTPFPAVVSDAFVALDGVELATDLDLAFVASSAQAQRLAKIKLLRTRQGTIATKACNLRALEAVAGENYRFTFEPLGWDAKAFELLRFDLSIERDKKAKPGFVIDITGQETDASIFDWLTDEENVDDPAPNTNLPNPRVVPTPTGLTLTPAAFLQPDGTSLSRLLATWTAAPSAWVQGGGSIELQYKTTAAPVWQTRMLPGTAEHEILADLCGLLDYDVRLRFRNMLGVYGAYCAPVTETAPADSVVPSAPTGLTASAGTGKAVQLSWTKHSDPRVAEYGIYRHSSNTPASATRIGQVSGTSFVDLKMPLDATSYYWVTAESASNVESAKSTVASATPQSIPEGGIDPTPPGNPSAPTLYITGTTIAADGSATAKLVINLPALPSLAVGLNVFWRVHGVAAGWVLADQIDEDRRAADSRATIDDLPTGTSVDVAVQAYSAYGICSAVVEATGSPFTTPTPAAPSAPSGLVLSTTASDVNRVPPAYAGSGGTKYSAAMLKWTASPSKDVAYYEIRRDAGVPITLGRTKGTETEFPLYAGLQINSVTDDIGVRAVSRSGVGSTWTTKTVPHSFTDNYGTADMAEQSSSAVAVTGIQTGNGSSVRKVLARYQNSAVPTLTGGAATENFNVSLSNRGFSTKPDAGYAQSSSDAAVLAAYDFDAAGNSSSNAVIRVTRRDGANLGAGPCRFSIELLEYD
ncbi:hypothetical protein [Opitutus terrae]|uniref:Fibronectin type III domain protein n=1 Tax=Opitutus terrae (strain DSM 11246 / JCM 15787 / PB90-1) TaxID=452637 RepID=B1ZV47_OPITP|nr:hypothetical protein [Opitutus terrae]ACB76714.1 Fibronectin type III domain protein [Opitutus terrae PB90-1]